MFPEMILHYRIIKKLGQGGMGEVYLAEDTRSGHNVALKLLLGEFNGNEDRVRRFKQEARATKALKHPNIIIIHDIGHSDRGYYIASEFIEGESLRRRLQRGSMTISESLDIAIQVASALAEAHKADIVHRDIKPENIMMDKDDRVKVLDFGLAKLPKQKAANTDSKVSTIGEVNTLPGMVIGTVSYMSPEQARGKLADARSDIFSLGIVLYEMISGRTPFQGETPADVNAALLERDPSPITALVPEVPPVLCHIINKSLRKNEDERYQTSKSMHADLKILKREMLDKAEQKSPPMPEPSIEPSANASPAPGARPMPGQAAQDDDEETARPISMRRRIARQIKTHGRSLVISLALLLITLTAAYFYFTREAAVAVPERLLLTDFENTTGDPAFDGTLKLELGLQLQQWRSLSILPEELVKEALLRMNLSNEQVTKEVGKRICEQLGIEVLIAGAIAPEDAHFVITLIAINGHSGEEIASQRFEAENKEGVTTALSQAVQNIHEKLGEPPRSIQEQYTPLEHTTTSIPALGHLLDGITASRRGNPLEAIAAYEKALKQDPNFAYAFAGLAVQYGNTKQMGMAAKYAQEAYNRLDKVTEKERFRITYFYHSFVTGDSDAAIAVLNAWKKTYKNDHLAPSNMTDSYLEIGEFNQTINAADEAIRLDKNSINAYVNKAWAHIRLNEFNEAKKTYKEALENKLDSRDFHAGMYCMAFAEGKETEMEEQIEWVKKESKEKKGVEYLKFAWQANAKAFGGDWRAAKGLSYEAIISALQDKAKGVAALYVAEASLHSAVLGKDEQEVEALVKESLDHDRNYEHNPLLVTRIALALAFCGQTDKVQKYVDILSDNYYSRNKLITGLWLPVIRATIALKSKNKDRPGAIKLLKQINCDEAVAEFWPQYIRGLAYLGMGFDDAAIEEFEKIINKRFHAPMSPLYPLAHLGLAMVYKHKGDTHKRDKYKSLFDELWLLCRQLSSRMGESTI